MCAHAIKRLSTIHPYCSEVISKLSNVLSNIYGINNHQTFIALAVQYCLISDSVKEIMSTGSRLAPDSSALRGLDLYIDHVK